MKKFLLKSGKSVELSLVSIEQALALYRAVLFECKNAGLDLSVSEEDTVLSLIMKNQEAVLNILSSETVLECTKECCAKVIYNKQKFSMDLFEDEKNRGDFLGLMMLVALENIRPFFVEAHIIFNAIESYLLKE